MRKGEATRERIIAQAAPIFNRQGYAGCSINDLMEATGLQKGGIYQHFLNKEELAAEAFRFALARNFKVRTEHLGEVSGAIDKLRRTIEIFVEEPSAIEGGCPLMNTAIEADDGNPLLRELALKGIQDWRARLCTIVEAGIKAKEIRKKTDARRVGNTIIATLEGALMISRLERTKSALKDAQALLGLMLDDIATG